MSVNQKRQKVTQNTQVKRQVGLDPHKGGQKDSKDLPTQKYYYKVEGRTKAILAERIKEYGCQKEKQADQSEEGKVDKEDVQLEYRIIRYYHDFAKDQVHRKISKCYRCGKKGHISSRCLQQRSQIKCYFCLQSHHYNQCKSSSICNNCGEIGHTEYECKASKIIKCQICKRKGHKDNECGAIKIKNRKGDNEDYKQYSMDKTEESDLNNLKCLNLCQKGYGHFSCYLANSTQDFPYEKQKEYQSLVQKYNQGNYTELEDY